MEFNGHEIDKIICSCGGEVEQVKTTDDEEEKYGCHRRECCVKALKCKKCGVRWTLDLCAPEWLP